MGNEEKKGEPIKVTDRRAFTSQGERRSPGQHDPGALPPERETPQETIVGEGFQFRHGPAQSAGRPLAPVEFNSFVLSLASTAFIHLGEMEDPITSKTQINLEGARQMIDIIDMLQVKTQGNLAAQEDEFLQGILYELRMRYSQRVSRGSS